MISSPLNFSGFAARTDLENEDLKIIFNKLEKDQSDFLAHEDTFRSKEYKWPKDPLHTWSRLWEYPYVYNQIQKIQCQRPVEKLKILDFGSGVTFFPFAVAQVGCDVICADIDPVVDVDIKKAANLVESAPGSVGVAIIENGVIPVVSESQDVVYCISVLEHVPNIDKAIDEVARVLKPGGILILSVDIDLRGNSELGVHEFECLQTKLDVHFRINQPIRTTHPCNLLTTANSPYNIKDESLLFFVKQLVKGVVKGSFVNGDPFSGIYLGVYATVLQKL